MLIFSDPVYYTRSGLIGVIAATGTICNGISLSFFLRNKKKSLADLHLIALNITDLLICILSPVNVFCLNEYIKKTQDLFYRGSSISNVRYEIHEVLFAHFIFTLSLLSCFITTVLSVSRAVVLTKPLYIIKKKYVKLSHCINAIFLLIFLGCKIATYCIDIKLSETLETGRSPIMNIIFTILTLAELLYVMITVMIVGVSSVVVARSLRKPPDIPSQAQQADRPIREANRKATVMILTLSVFFFIYNSTWCLIWAICTIIYRKQFDNLDDQNQLLVMISFFSNLFMIAINSSTNPVVYILRNSGLNQFTKTFSRGVWRFVMTTVELFLASSQEE